MNIRTHPMEHWLLTNELHMHYVKGEDDLYGSRVGMAVVDQLAAIKRAREVDAALAAAESQVADLKRTVEGLKRETPEFCVNKCIQDIQLAEARAEIARLNAAIETTAEALRE